MVSSTPEPVRGLISSLPEPYVDLAACFMTVVHDLTTGNSDRYQEKVAELAESYFVLMLETFRSPTAGPLAGPGVVRSILHQNTLSDGDLRGLPYTAQLVEAVYDQFEVRLWSLITSSFSNVVTMPDRGPCDFIVPVFGMLMKDRLGMVDYDNVGAMKSSTHQVFSTVSAAEIQDCVIGFCGRMVDLIRANPQYASRIRNHLLVFVSEFQQLAPDPVAERLEPLRLELSGQEDKAPAVTRAFALN
jgi:hypothetical protein